MSHSKNGDAVKIRKSLQALGKAHREIEAVYLFGSAAIGKTGPLSDLDIAVLLKGRLGPSRAEFRRELELTADVMHACRRSDVDVVFLNQAPPLLAYEVVQKGQVLFERDRARRVEFEVNALKRMFDLEPFLETARRILKRRLREGSYGG